MTLKFNLNRLFLYPMIKIGPFFKKDLFFLLSHNKSFLNLYAPLHVYMRKKFF